MGNIWNESLDFYCKIIPNHRVCRTTKNKANLLDCLLEKGNAYYILQFDCIYFFVSSVCHCLFVVLPAEALLPAVPLVKSK